MQLLPAISVALLIIVHLGLSFSMTYAVLGPGDTREFTVLGICFGQINLIGLWGALSSGSVVRRLPWAALLAAGLWFALTLGNRARGVWQARNDADRGDALVLGGLILLGAVATLVPLWISRRWFRWRLTSQPVPDAAEQFNLREMLVGTALLGIALTIIQAVLPAGSAKPTLDFKIWLAAPIAAAANLLVILPTIWMAFARPGFAVVYLLLILPLYALLVSALEIIVLAVVLGGVGNFDQAIFRLGLLNAGQCGVVAGTLLVLRLVGFRLTRAAISLKVPPVLPEPSPLEFHP